MLEINKLSHYFINPLIEFYKRNNFPYFQPHEFTRSYLENIIRTIELDFYCVVVYNKEIIGYGMLRGMDGGYKDYFLGIAIDKGYQGKGIGKLLMSFLETEASLRGQGYIKLKVHKNNLAAIKFYEGLGYFLYAYKKFALDEDYRCMEKRL